MCPVVGQPGVAPLMSGFHGLNVVDGRPGRRADAADTLRQAWEQIRREARARWDALDTPYVPRPVPAPEVPATWVERTDSRVPTGAQDLGRDARRLGFTVRYSYCRGTDVGRKDWRVVDNVCVWLRRGDDLARMTYLDGRAEQGVLVRHGEGLRACTVTALRAALGIT